MNILSVELVDSSGISHNGGRMQNWVLRYEKDGRQVKFPFNSSLKDGKIYLFHRQKDPDKAMAAMRASPHFERVRVTIASDALVNLVRQLGYDAVKQAFDEAVVKSVVTE